MIFNLKFTVNASIDTVKISFLTRMRFFSVRVPFAFSCHSIGVLFCFQCLWTRSKQSTDPQGVECGWNANRTRTQKERVRVKNDIFTVSKHLLNLSSGPGARIEIFFWLKIKKRNSKFERIFRETDCEIICQLDRGQGSALNGYE